MIHTDKFAGNEPCTLEPEIPIQQYSSAATKIEVYKDNTLDKVVDCFTRFKYALVRLSASHLLPSPVDVLISVLGQVEELYENTPPNRGNASHNLSSLREQEDVTSKD